MHQFASLNTKPLQRLLALVRIKSYLSNAPFLLGAAFSFAAIAAGLQIVTVHLLNKAQAEKASLSQDLQKLEQDVATRRLRGDFVRNLPATSDSLFLIATLQRQVLVHGVRLSTLSVKHHPVTNNSLASMEVGITLRGSYPEMKSVMVELLERVPHLRIQTLKFSKTTLQDIEAQFSVVQWLAPLSAMAPLK